MPRVELDRMITSPAALGTNEGASSAVAARVIKDRREQGPMRDTGEIQDKLEQLREHGFKVNEVIARDCITVSRDGKLLVLELRPHGNIVHVLDPNVDDIIPIPVNRIMHWVEDRFDKAPSCQTRT